MKNNALDVLRGKFPELVQWLKPLCRFNRDFEDFIVADYKEERLNLKIYTKEYQYSITAKLPEEGQGYLGCIVTTRKPRAGETWNRGNDLTDGSYSKETWDNIVTDIVSFETVKVVKTKNTEAHLVVDEITTPENDSSLKLNQMDK